jgi:hypothetical protein
MITVTRRCSMSWFDPGRIETISYDIRKSEVTERLLEAVRAGRHGFIATDPARLDAGDLPEAKLLELFTRDELEQVLARRREHLTAELDALHRLEVLLPRTSGRPFLSGRRQQVTDSTESGQRGHGGVMGGDAATRR